MKKKVSFEKKIDFPTMIGEVCAISLEHNLKFMDESNVQGDLLLSGKYKLTEASRLQEDFSYKIPIEISLTEKIDLNSAKVEITDFYYEIENEDTMVCYIELMVEGLQIVDLDNSIDNKVDSIKNTCDIEELRECDGDKLEEKEIEIPKIENDDKDNIKNEKLLDEQLIDDDNKEKDIDNTDYKMEMNEGDDNSVVETMNEIDDEDDDSLFINLKDEEETYGTFLVYIVRQNESINSIIEKYKTSLEELEKYNDLSNLTIGTKLIIPLIND